LDLEINSEIEDCHTISFYFQFLFVGPELKDLGPLGLVLRTHQV